MSTASFHIENAQIGDFLTFEHDSGLKSYMIFRAANTQQHPNGECYRFFAIVENNGNIHLQGECMYLEGSFRPCTADEKEFILMRLRREHLIWEATKQQLRRMTLFERIVYIFSNMCNWFKTSKKLPEGYTGVKILMR